MTDSPLFNSIDSVDSTNNYAMAKLHAGMATHGMAWCARTQTAGKGQRGKGWNSEPGKNILLSIVLKPVRALRAKPFFLSAFVAVCCHEFLKKTTGETLQIKWPNDLYWRDRKAGGILIENNFAGSEWHWAVVGIGININQSHFAENSRAVSLTQITAASYEPELLARQLYDFILFKYEQLSVEHYPAVLATYNNYLFKRNETVKLKKNSAVFTTTIRGVNESGQLITEDVMERSFNFGGVEWIL